MHKNYKQSQDRQLKELLPHLLKPREWTKEEAIDCFQIQKNQSDNRTLLDSRYYNLRNFLESARLKVPQKSHLIKLAIKILDNHYIKLTHDQDQLMIPVYPEQSLALYQEAYALNLERYAIVPYTGQNQSPLSYVERASMVLNFEKITAIALAAFAAIASKVKTWGNKLFATDEEVKYGLDNPFLNIKPPNLEAMTRKEALDFLKVSSDKVDDTDYIRSNYNRAIAKLRINVERTTSQPVIAFFDTMKQKADHALKLLE